MLSKIFYSYLNLSSLIVLVQRIRALLLDRFADHPMISTIMTNLEASLDIAVRAIGSSTRQPLTEVIASADRKRDGTFRSLRDHVAAGLQRNNEAYQQACEALWVEFEKNGLQLYTSAYAEETAAIDSLLSDLSKSENQPHLETIHAVDWVQELDRDNQAFKVAVQQRSYIRTNDGTLTDEQAFNQLKESAELLIHVLIALQASNDPVGINEAVAEIDQYIIEANIAGKQGQSNHTPKDIEV